MKNCIAILLSLSAFAHSAAILAVLEIVPTSEVVEELTISESRLLSDELRRQAVNLLPAKEFTVLTRDGIIALIPPDEEEAKCLAESCAVDIGRAIGVEYISTGQIAKFAGELSLTVELYETMGGRLLGSFLTYGTNLKGLMETIKAESPAMFERMKAHYLESKTPKRFEDKQRSPAAAKKKSASPPPVPSVLKSEDAGGDLKKEKNDDKSTFSLGIRGGFKEAAKVDTGIKSEGSSFGLSKWVAVGLEVLGAGAIGIGIYQNSWVAVHKKDYKTLPLGSRQREFDSDYEQVEFARNVRNACYIAGGALLLGGISIHIFF